MKIFLACIALMVVFTGILFSTAHAERVECYKWQEQASEYEGFYLTQWQAEQCEAHGIEIDAPIR